MAKYASEPPDLSTIAGRLRWAREKAGYSSMRGAAAANGWNENTYKSHEQGIRQKEALKGRYVDRYTRAFKVRKLWLLTGEGPAVRDDDADWDEMTSEERQRAIRLLRAAR